jgi:hypothetical protein
MLNSNWANNRDNTYLEKIQRWVHNPIGAIVRIIEKIYFGDNLFLLIKGYGDISEIRHLSKILDDELDTENYQYFSSARVSLTNRLILLDTGHISSPDHSSHSFLSGNMWREVHSLQVAKKVSNYSMIIPMSYPEYYYHYLIDDIPSLLQTIRTNPNHVPIFHGNIPTFASQILQALQLEYEIASDAVIEVQNLLVPRKKLNYMSEYRLELENRLSFGQQNSTKPRTRIFIGRKNLPRGDSKTELELFSMLEEFGFSQINPSDLSFNEQVQAFAEAEFIVSLHGGALSNLIFCSPGTRVIEVFNHEYRTYPFARISQELGLQYTSLELGDFEVFKRNLTHEIVSYAS